MPRYAEHTEVPVQKSKAAIETLLIQHGAKEFVTGWDQTHDRIQFRLKDQVIRFVLPRPDPRDRRFTHDKNGWLRKDAVRQRILEQADRQRWRALYLVVKAKLEAIEAGIASYEQEFLAFIVGPNDLTIGDILVPRLTKGTMWPALPSGVEG